MRGRKPICLAGVIGGGGGGGGAAAVESRRRQRQQTDKSNRASCASCRWQELVCGE